MLQLPFELFAVINMTFLHHRILKKIKFARILNKLFITKDFVIYSPAIKQPQTKTAFSVYLSEYENTLYVHTCIATEQGGCNAQLPVFLNHHTFRFRHS